MKLIYSLLLPILFASWSSVVFAQQIVSSSADAGPGSLRQAVLDAAPGENIRFSSTLVGQTVVLNSPLVVSQPLKITGSSQNRPVVQAQLIIDNAGTVTISNMRFTGNTAVLGGAINSISTELEIFNTIFEDNTATSDMAAEGGGEIAVSGGSANTEDCQFIKNQATGACGSGGAIIKIDEGIL